MWSGAKVSVKRGKNPLLKEVLVAVVQLQSAGREVRNKFCEIVVAIQYSVATT